MIEYLNIIFPLFSGILSAVAFSNGKTAYIIFFSLIPLIYSIKRSKNTFITMFIFSFSFYLIASSWILNAVNFLPFNKILNHICLFLFLFVIAFTQGIILSFPFIFYKKIIRNNILDYIFLASLYILGEFIQENIPYISFPWARLSAIVAEINIFIQSSSLLGGLFISFIIVLINGLIYSILENIIIKKSPAVPLTALIVTITANISFGMIRLSTHKYTPDKTVLLVQGNFSGEEKRTSDKKEITEAYLRLSYKNLTPETKMVVFPETAMPFYFDKNNEGTKALSEFAKTYNVTVLTGICTDNESGTFNSAVAFYPDGSFSEPYSKRILVPFGETIWFYDIISKIIPQISEMSSFTAGESPYPIKTDIGKIGGIICFESIYPEIARSTVKSGAEILAVISNDSWFGEGRAMYQHHCHSILRAVENERYLLRASSTAITSVISPLGEIIISAVPFKEETISSKISSISKRTVYSYVGDIIVIPCIVIFIYSVILYFLRGNRKPPYRRH